MARLTSHGLALLLTLLYLSGALAQPAQKPPAGGAEASLQAQASREVKNDRLVAVLAVQAQGSDPAALAEAVNRRMGQALKAAGEFPAIEAETGNYQSYLRQDEKQRVETWRISQELRLESGDFDALAKLVGRLQDDLVVRSMSAELSPAARRAAENALIADAIAAFRERAEQVRAALKAASYDIQTLDIGTGEAPPRPMAEMRAMSASAVALQPGTTRVTVTAAGKIALR